MGGGRVRLLERRMVSTWTDCSFLTFTDIIRRNDDICMRVVGLSGIKMGLDLCAQDL